MTITVNATQATAMGPEFLKANLVPYIKGSPACGKSSIVRQIAETYKLKLIDLRLSQCDPTDLLGFPSINNEKTKAGYVPMEMFPVEGDPIPENYNGWLLFLDEFNGADSATQKAAYKLVLDQMVGNHKLHEKCKIMAAGNLATDNALVEELSTALQSRFVHMELSTCPKAWAEWAAEANIDHRIMSYIRFKPDMLYTFRPDHSDCTYASPRTWEFTSRLLKTIDIDTNPNALELITGIVSEGVAREFLSFCKIYEDLPVFADIIANPEEMSVPTSPGTLYALIGSIANNVCMNTVNQVMKFVNRIPVSLFEFQVVCIQDMTRRNPDMRDATAIKQWGVNNAADLF